MSDTGPLEPGVLALELQWAADALDSGWLDPELHALQWAATAIDLDVSVRLDANDVLNTPFQEVESARKLQRYLYEMFHTQSISSAPVSTSFAALNTCTPFRRASFCATSKKIFPKKHNAYS